MEQKTHQPGISLGFRFWFMQVVEGFVHLFDSTKRTLHLPLGTSGDSPSILSLRRVSADLNPQIPHHFLKYQAAGNGTVVHVQHFGDALKGKICIRFRRHSGKHKAQRRFHVFPVDAVVFLILSHNVGSSTDNVVPGTFRLPHNLGRKSPCLWAGVFLFPGRYTYAGVNDWSFD